MEGCHSGTDERKGLPVKLLMNEKDSIHRNEKDSKIGHFLLTDRALRTKILNE
jgi:hypothetical protein